MGVRFQATLCVVILSFGCGKPVERTVRRPADSARQPSRPPAPTFPSVAQIETLNAKWAKLESDTVVLNQREKQLRAKPFSTASRNALALESKSYASRLQNLLLETSVIYGAESRSLLAVAATLDPALIQRSTAVVALVDRDDVEKLQDGCKLKTKSFLHGDSHPLCKNEKFRAMSTAAFCTGFLASPTQIATAGHCLKSQAQVDRDLLRLWLCSGQQRHR